MFAVSVNSDPGIGYIAMYRTNGTQHGGGLRFYTLTRDRLLRLLDAMLRISCKRKCVVRKDAPHFEWDIHNLVLEMIEAAKAQSTIAALKQ